MNQISLDTYRIKFTKLNFKPPTNSSKNQPTKNNKVIFQFIKFVGQKEERKKT